MLTAIHPKLPMRDKVITQAFYTKELTFEIIGDYGDYLMIRKENIEIHFFLFRELDPLQNYGQVYIRTDNIEECYQSFLNNNVSIHPNGPLEIKPWGQQEFSILDPDNNLLTFGQAVV
ncbi:bleomycin resistance protein [Sphingobacterium spiritivorum]|uniref:bleomycin resistance protein n=2 Tax=Sphingobacterium spiritivorum TaxID=258 RepID=UPI003DA257C9